MFYTAILVRGGHEERVDGAREERVDGARG